MKLHAELETNIRMSMTREVTIQHTNMDGSRNVIGFSDPTRIRAVARELMRLADRIEHEENNEWPSA